MSDYISRDELIKALETDYNSEWSGVEEYVEGARDEYDDVLKIVCGMKAADVQPVKHGKWDFQGYQLFKCTNCKEMFTQDQLEAMQNHKDCEECAFPNFCPNCGARMDGNTNG